MRSRFTRIIIFVVIVIGLGVGYNFFYHHFSGEGKDSPVLALPTDAQYEWIEGPKNEKEVRYFFLSNGNYFGTEVVSENFKGWRIEGPGSSSKLPNPLEENKIMAANSDGEILFGLIKPNGEVKVTVNDQTAERIPLANLSKEAVGLYRVEGYEIWYIDLSELEDSKNYLIQILDENNSLVNELSI